MSVRLDLLLVNRQLAPSRQRAKGLIEGGYVTVDGRVITKASQAFDEDCEIDVTGSDIPFVSRGGLKLQKAFDVFSPDVNGLVCADLGASSGGFTDCLLSYGAAYVYAVDAGHDQLVPSLKNDPRVCCMEGVNARYLKADDFDKEIDFVCADLSFISLSMIFPAIACISTQLMRAVCLVKPQFEAGRENVGKKGVVKDRRVHLHVLKNTLMSACAAGFGVRGITYSPVRGPEGNIEYLLYLDKSVVNTVTDTTVKKTVDEAFERL